MQQLYWFYTSFQFIFQSFICICILILAMQRLDEFDMSYIEWARNNPDRQRVMKVFYN